MKESVAVAKEADAKKGVSPTRSDKSILRVRNEPERQLGSLKGVIGNITRNGGTSSVESIGTELSGMHTAQRAPALLALQRTHGNRYVQRVVSGIQAKLKIGQPNDIYEQEADQVADAVMRMPQPGVQRQSEEEEEEEILQIKGHTGQTPEVTPDLESRINAQGGGGQPLPKSVRAFFEPRFGHDFSKVKLHTNTRAAELARTEITPLMQRQESLGEEKDEELIQAKIARDVTPEVTPAISSGIQSLQGGGRPLSETERSFFEPRFGADFSNVRIHSDTRAASVARSVNARAFTFGHNVVFGAGEYSPDASSGRKLFAHELTHVLQQCSGEIPKVRKPTDLTQTGQMEMTETADRSLTTQLERPEITVKISPSMIAASWEEQDGEEWQEFHHLHRDLQVLGFVFEECTHDNYGPSRWRVRLPTAVAEAESMNLIPTSEEHYRIVGRDRVLDQMRHWIQTEEERNRPRELRDAQTRFDGRHEHLTRAERQRIHAALASVLSHLDTSPEDTSPEDTSPEQWLRNLPLWNAYYNHYTAHPLEKIAPSQAQVDNWAENELARTRNNITTLRENVLGSQYPVQTLGGLLIHEYVHVRHPINYSASQVHLEGEAYGVEFFFAERTNDQDRMSTIIPKYNDPTRAGCSGLQIPAFRRLFRIYYGTLVCLYEEIDNPHPLEEESLADITMSHHDDLTYPILGLDRSEIYEMVRELVAPSGGQDRDSTRERLRRISSLVSANLDRFPVRMPS